MPQSTAAKKAVRQTVRHAARNSGIRRRVREQVRTIKRAVAAKDSAAASKALPELSSVLDKAVKANVIHKNAASRRKARISKLVASLSTAKAGAKPKA